MVAETHIVHAVHEITDANGQPWWQVDLLLPDNTIRMHAFPVWAIEQRIGEYGLNPDDPAAVDQALDMILHEPHVPNPMEHGNRENDAAARLGMTATATRARPGIKVGDTVPATLYNADDTTTARDAHLARIGQVKRDHVVVESPKGKPDPLDVIRRGTRVDPARVEEVQTTVRHVRARRQGRMDEVRETAERLRFFRDRARKGSA